MGVEAAHLILVICYSPNRLGVPEVLCLGPTPSAASSKSRPAPVSQHLGPLAVMNLPLLVMISHLIGRPVEKQASALTCYPPDTWIPILREHEFEALFL